MGLSLNNFAALVNTFYPQFEAGGTHLALPGWCASAGWVVGHMLESLTQ
jgi:hypothetical protein